MSRTTKAARPLLDASVTADAEHGASPARAAEPQRTPVGAADPGSPASGAQPAYFMDEAPAAAPEPVTPEPAVNDLGRLQDLLDRAGDPVPASDASSAATRGGRRTSARWRHDPHPLGRIAAVLVVLTLLGACVAVGLRVLG